MVSKVTNPQAFQAAPTDAPEASEVSASQPLAHHYLKLIFFLSLS